MPDIHGYYLFDPSRGWLQDDEKTWADDFHGATCITRAELAHEIGTRETPSDSGAAETFYILACLVSM